ncbi:MAG: hypothetical protein MUC33_01260 [Desulfobacterales bacterium]|jgi:hypothetical protein|nr:hypothetical protein [Desulfobacterales bacterium]MCU0601271.1 hypothetical protein [Desulfobacterales bacterium]
MKSPCLTCDRLHKTKRTRRCYNCADKERYLASIEQAPECRADPCYQSAYSLPRTFARQLGPVRSFSEMDMILTF